MRGVGSAPQRRGAASPRQTQRIVATDRLLGPRRRDRPPCGHGSRDHATSRRGNYAASGQPTSHLQFLLTRVLQLCLPRPAFVLTLMLAQFCMQLQENLLSSATSHGSALSGCRVGVAPWVCEPAMIPAAMVHSRDRSLSRDRHRHRTRSGSRERHRSPRGHRSPDTRHERSGQRDHRRRSPADDRHRRGSHRERHRSRSRDNTYRDERRYHTPRASAIGHDACFVQPVKGLQPAST